jgi:4-carboxymuconolactone decarboxylase
MTDYLPTAYTAFRAAHPEVAEALDGLGAATEHAGPLDERSVRLIKLGIALGTMSEGAVRSNVRKAIQAGATGEDVRHAALLTITTIGFPAAVAGLTWVDEVLGADDSAVG